MAKGIINNPVNTIKTALKSASASETRPVLHCVVLHERGDVFATDAYRLGVIHSAYEGETIMLPYDTAKAVTKRKASANKAATVELVGDMVKVTMADGAVITGEALEKQYPNVKPIGYKKVLAMAEPRIYPEVETKILEPVLKEHVRMKQNVILEMERGTLHVRGIGEEQPTYELKDTHCEGYERIGVNPAYLLDAMRSIGKSAHIGIGDWHKPIRVTNDDESVEVIVMPVNIGKSEKKKEQPMNEPKPTENIETLAGEHVTITGTLPNMTRARAFARLAAVGGNKAERFSSKTTVLVVADKAGREKREAAEKAIAKGQKVTIIDGTTFEAVLTKMEAEYAARPKPKRANTKKPVEIKVTKATITPTADGIVATPTEETTYVVTDNKAEISDVKPVEPEPIATTATTITLETMRAWANDKDGVRIHAAGTGERQLANPIWVCGDTRPYKDELSAMGFAFGTSKKFGKGWYRKPETIQ